MHWKANETGRRSWYLWQYCTQTYQKFGRSQRLQDVFRQLVCISAVGRNVNERGIWAVGTIRKDRMEGCQLKSDKEMKKDRRGSYDNKSNDKGVTIVKWYDSKPIHIVYHKK